MARKRLGELLVQAGVIDDMQLRAALGEQRKWGGRPLGALLIDMHLLDEKTLIHVLSQQLNIPAVDTEQLVPSTVALQFLDAQFCQKSQCIPFRHTQKGNFLDVAMADPTSQDTFDRIRLETRCNVRPYLAGPTALENLIRKHYFGQAPHPPEDNRPYFQPDDVAFDPSTRHLDPGLGDFDQGMSNLDPSVTGPQAPVHVPPVHYVDAGGSDGPALALDIPSPSPAPGGGGAAQELMRMREELSRLSALLERDEKVIRKLMALLVEKGLCTKQELMARISED